MSESLRSAALRLRRLLAVEHYLNSAHDFAKPRDCPYCIAIDAPLPRVRRRAVEWPSVLEKQLARDQAEIARLRAALAGLYEYTAQASHVCVHDKPTWRDRCPVAAARAALAEHKP